MIKPAPHLVWFKDVSIKDIDKVGVKGANLGEMTRAGLPVPNGFIVTTSAYFNFLRINNLETKIEEIINNLDATDNHQLETKSKKIRELILAAQIPKEIIEEVYLGYEALRGERPDVAIRSSSSAEDLSSSSFAGQQTTFLNQKGQKQVIKGIQLCWASHFTEGAILARSDKKINHLKCGIGVIIQTMIQSEVSGVIFTDNPLNQDKSTLVVESIWGLGEMIVQGKVTPDHFEVHKKTLKIVSKHISPQLRQLTKVDGITKEELVSKSKKNAQKVSDSVIVRIARLGIKLHTLYGIAQDIEWTFYKGRLYVLQTRPIAIHNTLGQSKASISIIEEGVRAVLFGSGACPGIVVGKVKIFKNFGKTGEIKTGDILVISTANSDMVPSMKRAAAIIADEGGQTSHAAIISRELGVPCIVGTGQATKILKEGAVITVDATNGKVFLGELELQKSKMHLPKGLTSIREIKTTTKVYVNIDEPELAVEVSERHVDGIGMLNPEFIISEYIGTHPQFLLEKGRRKFFIDKLAEGLSEFCHAFGQRPVIYKTANYKSDEYQKLQGGEKYEIQETNPIIGFRGGYRNCVDDEVFLMEIEAIKKVRDKMGYKNLHVATSFIRTVSEFQEIKHFMAKNGLGRRHNFKVYMMVEIPNNVLLMDEFIDIGLDGVCVNVDSLTELILGCDQHNEKTASLCKADDKGVQKALEIIVRTCKRRGVTSCLSSKSTSTHLEMIKNAVSWGLGSVSVSPDKIDQARLVIHEAESTKYGQNKKPQRSAFRKLFAKNRQ